MKYFGVSLVTVKSLNLLFGDRDCSIEIVVQTVKRTDENEMRTIFLKSDIYDPF